MSTPLVAPSALRPRRSFWVYVPPPPLFIVAFLIGIQLAHLVPLRVVPTSWETFTMVLGIGAMLAAVSLIISAPLLFLVHRTTIIPHATANTLVTTGPYRLTRNPMYLALTVGFIGVALLMNILWPLLLLAIPVWIMNAKVIPAEEAKLIEVFGDQYRAYQARVGRWL